MGINGRNQIHTLWERRNPREKAFVSLVGLIGVVLLAWTVFGGVPDACQDYLASIELELSSQRPDNTSTFGRLYDQFDRTRKTVGRIRGLNTSTCPCEPSTIQTFTVGTTGTVSDIIKRQRAELQRAFDDECPSISSKDLSWKQVEEAFEKYSRLYEAVVWENPEIGFPKELISEVDKCVTLARVFGNRTDEPGKIAALSEILKKHAEQPYDHDKKIRQALVEFSGEKNPAFKQWRTELAEIVNKKLRHEERLRQIKEHADNGAKLFPNDREVRSRVQSVSDLVDWLLGGKERQSLRRLHVHIEIPEMANYQAINLIVQVRGQEPTVIKELRKGIHFATYVPINEHLPPFNWQPGDSISFHIDASQSGEAGTYHTLGERKSVYLDGLEILELDFNGLLNDKYKCELTFEPSVDVTEAGLLRQAVK